MKSITAVLALLVASTSGFASLTVLRSSYGYHFSSKETASWKVWKAVDNDLPIAMDLLERKRAFHRAMRGAKPSMLESTAGENLESLFPEIKDGQIMFVASDSAADVVGFALYNIRYYSLDSPPSLWLEDIFIDYDSRGAGAGKAIMNELASVAYSYDCSHLAWQCDYRNKRGLEFYDHLGAQVTGQEGDQVKLTWVPPCLPIEEKSLDCNE